MVLHNGGALRYPKVPLPDQAGPAVLSSDLQYLSAIDAAVHLLSQSRWQTEAKCQCVQVETRLGALCDYCHQ